MHDVSSDYPGRYGAEIAIMQEMNWSWIDLQQAPLDLIQEILVRIQAQRKWQKEKDKLDNPDSPGVKGSRRGRT